MPFVRVTKEFSFEAAHALWKHDGKCENIHGHSYWLSVTVCGEPLNKKKHPKDGMLIDFSALKKIIHDSVIDIFDHVLILNTNMEEENIRQLMSFNKRIMVVDYQPTSENLIVDFAGRIQSKLPSEIKLYSLKLQETAASYVEWYADENQQAFIKER